MSDMTILTLGGRGRSYLCCPVCGEDIIISSFKVNEVVQIRDKHQEDCTPRPQPRVTIYTPEKGKGKP